MCIERFVCQVNPDTRDARTVLSYLVPEMVNLQLQVKDRIRDKLGSSGEQNHS